MPQFTKQTSRPLTAAGYRARASRMRELCELIERYADPSDVRDKQQLTRAIHGLSYAARNLSDKHNGRTHAYAD